MTAVDGARSPEQATRERAQGIVFDAIQEIEHLASRVRRHRGDVDALPDCSDLATVLGTAADRLDQARRELMQGALFNSGQTRLF